MRAAGIETRYWSVGPEYFTREGGLFLGGRRDRFVGHTKRQEDWRREVTKVCSSIARELLSKAEAEPSDVGLVSFNSTTGYSNPDIPALVASRIGMPHSVRRTQILGMGCYGSIPSFVRCVEALESGRCGDYAMQLTSELCSYTFRPFDRKDKGYKIAAIIFSDGSAGLLLKRDGRGPRVLDYETYTDYRTFPEMSYELEDEGMKFVLSKRVPEILGKKIHEPLNRLLERNDMDLGSVDHFLVHPGGLAILREVYGALGLDLEKYGAVPLEINRRYGNMSSATIWFCLEKLMTSGKWKGGQRAMLVTFGPGLTLELVLLQKGWT